MAHSSSDFNPRHPYGWRLQERKRKTFRGNFNPRHPYGWRRVFPLRGQELVDISIHATHTGGDDHCGSSLISFAHFNPRHPYGWRLPAGDTFAGRRNFNPRHPYGWRLYASLSPPFHQDISIHATHTGGDGHGLSCHVRQKISIHATHTGGDVGGRIGVALMYISIHATHTGGDPMMRKPSQHGMYFNPRHPYGWRQ